MKKHISALVVMMLAGAMAMFALAFTSTSASAAEVEYSTDPENPTLVEEVPEGFTALGDPTSTTEDCITTTEQVYSRTTEGTEGEVQTTDWLTEPPEGEGWVQIDQRTVTDVEAVPDSYTEWSAWVETQSGLLSEPTVPANTDVHEWRVTGPVSVGNGDATEDTWVFDHWQRYSLTGGSWPEGGAVPAFPDPGEPFSWQPNVQGDPHNVGVEGAYSRSHGQSGNTDWFYLEAVERLVPGQDETFHDEWAVEERTREFVPGSDAVTHEEYRYQRTLTGTEDITEYVYTSVVTGESCPDEPKDPEEPKEPNEPNTPVNTPDVPRTIDAGLSSVPTADAESGVKFALLLGSGLLVMLAAGTSLVATRRVGTEQ